MTSGSQLNRLWATCSTMKTLTPAHVHFARRSPRLLRPTCPSFRLQPRRAPRHRFLPPRGRCATSAYRTTSGLRHGIAGSPLHYAESSSSSYGPTVRLRLLPTPLRGDAVTFGYGAVTYSDTDLHRADLAPSRAHDSRLRGNDTAYLIRAAAPASKRSVEIIARV